MREALRILNRLLNLKFFHSLLLCCLWTLWLAGQTNCQLSVVFQIVDASSGKPIRDASITLTGNRRDTYSAQSDPNGRIGISKLCAGEYHYTMLHAKCTPEKGFFRLSKDTTLILYLYHSNIVLPEVQITDHRIRPEDLSLRQVNPSVFGQQQYKPLSEILTAIPGVTILKTGGQIAKPLIRGMNSQRLAVLNHGMPQAGQQWGNDHAPEISSFIYDSTSVIRGIASVEYPAGHMGGALVADKISTFTDDHLHGTYNTGYFSNGHGFWNHLKLEKGDQNEGGLRADVAYKLAGDLRAPDYYLRNTGVREFSAGILWKRNLTDQISNSFNYNYFQTTIGILRGAHVGNVSDLMEALQKDRPFFTEEQFFYTIDLPRQEVFHHTLSNLTQIKTSNGSHLNVRLGFQYNNRNEFDFRRSGENDRPALSLVQWDFFADAVYQKKDQKTGIIFRLTDNTNNPETGILPLIPDFLSHRVALFHSNTMKIAGRKTSYGGRYELTILQAFPIVRSIPMVVLEDYKIFHTATTNVVYPIAQSSRALIIWEGQVTMRAPEVNELYSFGLHQGVAGIEEGNPDLKTEFGFQNHLNTLIHYHRVTLRADAYAYLFQNFINLEPTGELRTTIRGAFPVFKYNQYRLALLTGIDGMIDIAASDNLTLEFKNSFLYAQNLSEGKPLAWMPANRAETGLNISLPNIRNIKNPEWKLSTLLVARQWRLLPDQDFMPPPPGYVLFNSSISFRIPFKKNLFQVSISVENLFNHTYRDFLNRWKYFSDDIGRNIIISVKYIF